MESTVKIDPLKTPKNARAAGILARRIYSVLIIWRRVRDLNPGYAHHVHTISNRAPSTTQPTLHILMLSSNVLFIIAQAGNFVKPFFVLSALTNKIEISRAQTERYGIFRK